MGGVTKTIAELKLSKEVLIFLQEKKYDKATEKLAKYIQKKHTIYTIRDDVASEMWVYVDGIYEPHAKTYIKESLRTIIGSAYQNRIFNDVVAKIEADTYIDQEKFFADENPYLLPVKNGIVNLKTKNLLPFTPKIRFFNKINATFDPDADCPSIKAFFKSTLRDKEDILVMQEIFGFCLPRDYFLEKAIMFTGAGRNGKSKSVDILKRFLKLENCSSVSLQSLEKDNFALSELHKKMVNISADISAEAIRNTGNFKNLTGRDPIGAARKFLPQINFQNYAKMIFCANEIPITHDESFAFFNRWVLIDFIFTFLSAREYELLDTEDWGRCKIADPQIIDKITTDEELSGLLNWALEGLARLLNNNDFSTSATTKQIKDTWLRKSNSFKAFVLDCIEGDISSFIRKDVLKKIYSLYCQNAKVKTMGDKTIRYTLANDFGATDDRRFVNGDRVRLWSGIKFKDSAYKMYDVANIEASLIDAEDEETPEKPEKP